MFSCHRISLFGYIFVPNQCVSNKYNNINNMPFSFAGLNTENTQAATKCSQIKYLSRCAMENAAGEWSV